MLCHTNNYKRRVFNIHSPPPPKRTEFGQQNFTLNGVWIQVLISDNIDECSHTKPLAQDDQVYHCNPCRC